MLGVLPSSGAAAAVGVVVAVAGLVVAGPVLVISRVQAQLGSSVATILGGLQPPVVEEFLVRGIVWAVLARSWPVGMAFGWSSLLFWTFHLEFGLAASAITGVVGAVVEGGARLLSSTIWVGMLFHLVGNSGVGQPLFPLVALSGVVFLAASWVRARRGRTSG
jgi:membrane protease YdiL (CAAX protease family)